MSNRNPDTGYRKGLITPCQISMLQNAGDDSANEDNRNDRKLVAQKFSQQNVIGPIVPQ
jgi:hypothetical protein